MNKRPESQNNLIYSHGKDSSQALIRGPNIRQAMKDKHESTMRINETSLHHVPHL